MSKPHVVVAVPAYAGTVHIGFMRSLIADVMAMARAGWRVSINDQCHGAEIDTVRAQIVSDFMAGDGTHMMMVDSDLCWQAGGIMRLVEHDVDFVCGAYPHRKDPITWPLHLLETRTLIDGLLEIKAAPGGFMCVSRKALQKMIDKYADLEFESSKTNNRIWALFDHVWEGRTRLSEDLSFCARWRELGGKVWLDPSIQIGHIGPKMFVGKLGEIDGDVS